MERAFVAGATGYTGQHVVQALRRRAIPTVAHVRPDSGQLDAWRERFEALGAEVDCTPWNPEAMGATLNRLAPDAVFALLGTTRKRARATRRQGGHEDYEAVDFGLTALLHGAAAAAGLGGRFVYLSAAGVGEGSANAYYRARARAEAVIRAGSLPWTIARPSFISGPDRPESRPMERGAAVVADNVLALLARLGVPGPRDRWASLTGAELGEALVRAAQDPAGVGRILEADALRALLGD